MSALILDVRVYGEHDILSDAVVFALAKQAKETCSTLEVPAYIENFTSRYFPDINATKAGVVVALATVEEPRNFSWEAWLLNSLTKAQFNAVESNMTASEVKACSLGQHIESVLKRKDDTPDFLDALQTAAYKTSEFDPVQRPKHYNSHPSGIECIQVTEHMGFNIGNAMKYLWRADEKGAPLQDLQKAVWYINREIEKRSK